MRPLRRAWAAAAAPGPFFAALPDTPALGPAVLSAAASLLVAVAALALVLVRATDSAAFAPFLVATPVVVLPYVVLISVLGSLLLMRPAGLDLRAFEIVAWAWVPSGFLAVPLLPVGWFAPWPTLAGAALMLPVWHLWLVWRGTQAHAVGGARTAWLLYLVAVFALPLVLTGFTLTVLSRAS